MAISRSGVAPISPPHLILFRFPSFYLAVCGKGYLSISLTKLSISKNTAPYEEVPFVNDLTGNIRGYSVADMAECIETGRTDFMAPGKRARHLLHVMEKILESADTGTFCKIDASL